MMIRKAAVVLLCLVALSSQVASAQLVIGRSSQSVTGTVSGVDGSVVLLFDNRLRVDASDATITADFGYATLADLTPGTRVVAGVTNTLADGTLMAATVQILSDYDASISASIQSIDRAAGTLRVAGQTIRYTDETVFRRTNDGAVVTAAELRPLQQVILSLDGDQPGLVAETIHFFAAPETATTPIGGTLRAINGDRWTIGGGPSAVVVRVTPDTHIVGSPQIGDRVHVSYRGGADGDLIAVFIAKITDISLDDVAGPVVAIGPGSITIAGAEGNVRVMTNGSTQYIGEQPQVGDLVVARLSEERGGKLAREIEPITMTDFTFALSGPLASIDGNKWTVQGVPIYLTGNTVIVGTPNVGDNVDVLAMQVNETWYAVFITKL